MGILPNPNLPIHSTAYMYERIKSILQDSQGLPNLKRIEVGLVEEGKKFPEIVKNASGNWSFIDEKMRTKMDQMKEMMWVAK